jgi:beta-1,4-mannosyl-glycoprotein beta-1,4-N-acetylglucosaminyltransferase
MNQNSISIVIGLMIKKNKIYDCFFYYDEIECLIMRLNELEPHVEKFILIEFDRDFTGKKKETFLDVDYSVLDNFREKLIYKKIEVPNLDEIQKKLPSGINTKNWKFYNFMFDDFFRQYFQFIGELDLEYEDIILLSDIDEIPNFIDFEFVVENLKYGPVVLQNLDFLSNHKFVNNYKHSGSLVFYQNHIYSQSNQIKLSHDAKLKGLSVGPFTTVDNGWHMSHFYPLDKIIRKFELLSPILGHDINKDEIIDSLFNVRQIKKVKISKSFREYNGNLPIFHFLLKSQDFIRKESEKHLVTDEYGNNDDSYKSISIINPTRDFKVHYENVVDDTSTIYNILLPSKPYYTSENFEFEFLINEIKHILKKKLLLDHDVIEFKLRGFETTMNWLKIKNELIFPQIKNPSLGGV